jgi:inner membrane protein
MNGNCHLFFGISTATALALNLDKIAVSLPNIGSTPEWAALLIFGAAAGSIFPDIDNENSHTAKLTAPVSSLICGINQLFGNNGKKHRGLLHDPFIYLLGLYLSYMFFPVCVPFFIGCITHVFLDIFNPAGVPFLFGVKHLSLKACPSASKGASILTVVWSVTALAVGIGLKFYL